MYTDLAFIFSIKQPQDNKYDMDSCASSHMIFNQCNMLSLILCNSESIMVGKVPSAAFRVLFHMIFIFTHLVPTIQSLTNLMSIERFVPKLIIGPPLGSVFTLVIISSHGLPNECGLSFQCRI